MQGGKIDYQQRCIGELAKGQRLQRSLLGIKTFSKVK